MRAAPAAAASCSSASRTAGERCGEGGCEFDASHLRLAVAVADESASRRVCVLTNTPVSTRVLHARHTDSQRAAQRERVCYCSTGSVGPPRPDPILDFSETCGDGTTTLPSPCRPAARFTLALRRGAPLVTPTPCVMSCTRRDPISGFPKRVGNDHPAVTLSPSRSLTLALRRGAPPGRSRGTGWSC